MSEEKEKSRETEKIIWCDLPISNFIKTCFTYNLKQESRSRLIQISQIRPYQPLPPLNKRKIIGCLKKRSKVGKPKILYGVTCPFQTSKKHVLLHGSSSPLPHKKYRISHEKNTGMAAHWTIMGNYSISRSLLKSLHLIQIYSV